MLGKATGSLNPEVCPQPHLLVSQLPWKTGHHKKPWLRRH